MGERELTLLCVDSSVAFNEEDESPQPVFLLAQDISGVIVNTKLLLHNY
jgi:hypothetical protein